MSEAGYVHIYRSLIGHPAFRNDAESMAFAWMVMRAAWRPVRVRYKHHPISLERGQLAISVRDMATALDRDKSWVERLWKRLKSETMIETVSETGVSIVTICNYDDFQPVADSGETPNKTPRKTKARQTRDTEQRREEGKKEEEEEANASPSTAREPAKPKAKLKSSPAPIPDWMPSEQWAGFIAMRVKAGKRPTDRAVSLLIGKLETLKGDGHDPGAVLDQSTLKNWLDLYPVKAQNDDRSGNNDRRDGLEKACDRVIDGAQGDAGRTAGVNFAAGPQPTFFGQAPRRALPR